MSANVCGAETFLVCLMSDTAHFLAPFLRRRVFAALVFPAFALSAVAEDASKATSNGGANAAIDEAAAHLAAYREQLAQVRNEFGGSRELPDEHFFLFGMGLRPKLIYKAGQLLDAHSGAVVRRWDVATEVIVPNDYSVRLRTAAGENVGIVEDERGLWIETASGREAFPGSEVPLQLPTFAGRPYAAILRVLHQELLFNVTKAGPTPNLFVYPKPWYRDGAMVALCLKETGNLDQIRDWILALREPYDRNNAGETEADNLGEALFLVSLVSDAKHPLVEKVLAELPKFEHTVAGERFILGHSDFADRPVYQTKWLKYGLRALGLPDPYTIPQVADGYSALFWMDYRDAYVPGHDSADRGAYPYLGWACDHFHKERKSPISNRDYPLTWEQNASQADYSGTAVLSAEYAKKKISAPHTWHAAEAFLDILAERPMVR